MVYFQSVLYESGLVYKALYCTRRSDVRNDDMNTSLVSYGDTFKIVILEYGSPNKLGDYSHHFIGRQSPAICLLINSINFTIVSLRLKSEILPV